jgi:hypothetical protein
MFSKAKTETERQKIFDDYLLGILKNKEVIKKNKKIIDKNKFGFDPSIDDSKAKGAFNSYVDSLVIKNFLIEQIYTRLKINKSMAVNFVNKLDGNQLLILSKVINEFIKDIQSKHFSINDYILQSSFQELQTNYNVLQQQEKNKEIVKKNQQEQGEVLEQNIPAEQLGEPTQDLGVEETKGEDDEEETDNTEEKLMEEFLDETIFKFQGETGGISPTQMRKIVLEDVFKKSFKTSSNKKMKEFILKQFKRADSKEDKKNMRIRIQGDIFIKFINSQIPDDIKEINKDLFETYGYDTRKKGAKQQPYVVGDGARRKGKMLFVKGGSYAITHQPKGDEYIPLGKYKAHRTKLIGGKLQIRSHNNNQVYNLKSQNITNNIRDIFIKLNKNEKITFKDVDKLNAEEKNQLYTLGKKLHITELFDIPSTLKSNEDKLKDEFNKLRGSLVAGNNSPELLRKFKIVMLQMKNNKLISLQEYNEVLNILLEMEI